MARPCAVLALDRSTLAKYETKASPSRLHGARPGGKVGRWWNDLVNLSWPAAGEPFNEYYC